jgi:hypothetical protein
MAVAVGAAYFGRSCDLDPGDERVDSMRRAKTDIVKELGHSTYWVSLFQDAARRLGTSGAPATMLRPVEFDTEEDLRVVRVRFRPVEEPDDTSW